MLKVALLHSSAWPGRCDNRFPLRNRKNRHGLQRRQSRARTAPVAWVVVDTYFHRFVRLPCPVLDVHLPRQAEAIGMPIALPITTR